jgi:hypothetical protein
MTSGKASGQDEERPSSQHGGPKPDRDHGDHVVEAQDRVEEAAGEAAHALARVGHRGAGDEEKGEEKGAHEGAPARGTGGPWRRGAGVARGAALIGRRGRCRSGRMTRVFDMGDRDRLPSRFFGAAHGVRAQG